MSSPSPSILSRLIDENSNTEAQENTTTSETVSKTKKYTCLLANHLPTRTLLVYQLLSPILTDQGNCDGLGKTLIAVLIGVCATLCFLLSFTDSFKDKKGIVRYGIVTVRGLWVIEGSEKLSAQESAKYKLKFVDFVHAFMTLFVFGAVALTDTNVASCFYPSVTSDMSKMLVGLPVVISTVCSSLFVIFPCNRHSLGFPTACEADVKQPSNNMKA